MRVVPRVENPNPLMMMVPKFEIPPFGMLPGQVGLDVSPDLI